MNWKATSPALEHAAAAIAAACLGGAVGFAVARVALLGAGLLPAIAAGAVAALFGWLVIGRINPQRAPQSPRFAPVESIASIVGSDHDDTLLLDEPLPALPALDPDSRVVRLFAVQPAPALAGPGEMIARIEDFLGHPRGAHEVRTAPRTDPAGSDEARAALHAALADIRRSLRQ